MDTMNSNFTDIAAFSDDDIIEIDTKWKIIGVLHWTLTLSPHDTLVRVLSGICEESLKWNDQGRMLLDEYSELIEIMIPSHKKESGSIEARTVTEGTQGKEI